MIFRKQYYKALKEEIINDPSKQGYDNIFRKRYKNPRDRYLKIAEKINICRAEILHFPIVRTNIVELVMRDN